MDWLTFDKAHLDLLKAHRYRDAERQLVQLYERAQSQCNADLLEQAVSRLAQFYSLPLTGNHDRAAFFFGEREKLFDSDYSRLQTALFRFYCLEDPASTLEKLDQITSTGTTDVDDVKTQFTATALRGECLLRLGRIGDLPQVVTRLFELATKYPGSIVHGDAFNFLSELISRKFMVDDCRRMVEFFLRSPLSTESRGKAIAIHNATEDNK